MTALTMTGLLGVEHVQPDGRFVAHSPTPAPAPIHAGDRLRLRLAVSDAAWIYAVSVIRQADYRKLGAWAPGERAQGDVRRPWPGGRVLSADEATLTSLIIVASHDELPWARDLTRLDGSALVGTLPAASPTTAVDHLYGLFWKIQPVIRGRAMPRVEALHDGDCEVPAIAIAHHGAPYVALEWQFRSTTER